MTTPIALWPEQHLHKRMPHAPAVLLTDCKELILHLHCDVSALLSSDVRLHYMSRPVSTAAAPQQVSFRPDGPGAEAAETVLNGRYRVVRDLAR